MEPAPESVLLVEDDEATRTFLADNLAADGFQVATASAPGEAVRAVELRRPGPLLLHLPLEGGKGLTVDPPTRAVRLRGAQVRVSAKEFSLLHMLASDPTRVFSKAELLRDVWGYLSVGNSRTVDAHACRLRRKLSGTGRGYVVNVRGVGYRLTELP